ncbi:hypothetical protein, partial [Paractinoplanes brasiliensis]|uniref:hypothetical protein n=1 Tax=Paractinoplanes brasiliensis TaxID=52695 RepID=UPI001942AB1A
MDVPVVEGPAVAPGLSTEAPIDTALVAQVPTGNEPTTENEPTNAVGDSNTQHRDSTNVAAEIQTQRN